ncbi:sensor histidine kinase [Streptomyces sp. NPDC003011]
MAALGSNTGKDLHRRVLRPVCAALGTGVVAAGLVAGPTAGWRATVPMAVAVLGTLVTAGLRGRVPVAATAAVVAVSSALGTVLGRPPAERQSTGLVTLVEIAAELLLVCLVVRYAIPRWATVTATALGLAASTAILRLQVPDTLLETAAQSAFFALGAVAAAAVGGWLRALEARRVRSVHEARRSQRLHLARDLHDFVAHDVSGIVVLAQAAQVIGADQPEKVLPILEQIEAAGLQALGSMDRTVHMLDDSSGPAAGPGEGPGEGAPQAYGLADIVDVVERFREAGRTEVRMDIDLSAEQAARVPREVASTAHRVVVEALTNVRRHAAAAPLVRVSVRPGLDGPDEVLTVTVANSAPSLTEPGSRLGDGGRRGGTGLEGLAGRVGALGGRLDFGGDGDGGWRVTAVLPVG